MVLFLGFLFLFPQSKPAQIASNITAPNFFPFTKTPAVTVPEKPVDISGTGVEPIPTVTEQNTAIIKKISTFPVSGFGTFSREVFTQIPVSAPENTTTDIPQNTTDTKTPVKPTPPSTEFISSIRYANKADGNIYQAEISEANQRKFTSTIIPKIYEAFFTKKPNAVALRYLKEDNQTIQTFLGTLPEDLLGADSAGNDALKGSFLPENITDMSISPDGSQMFYLFNLNDTSVGMLSDGSGARKTQIFSSPFTSWLSQLPNPKLVTLTTKASDGLPGFMYTINTDKKDLTNILGNINGLTTLTSPSGRMVLYSSSTNGNLSLNIYNVDTGTTNLLGARTLPEKCVWTKDSSTVYCAVPKFLDIVAYPDSWYQGLTSFSDEIWKIDTFSGSGSRLADPMSIAGEEVDGIKLGLDDNEDYLFFINKKDNFLWELKTK